MLHIVQLKLLDCHVVLCSRITSFILETNIVHIIVLILWTNSFYVHFRFVLDYFIKSKREIFSEIEMENEFYFVFVWHEYFQQHSDFAMCYWLQIFKFSFIDLWGFALMHWGMFWKLMIRGLDHSWGVDEFIESEFDPFYQPESVVC